MIKREDMLELTRRMTVKRTHLTRVAGCYVDRDGEFDGSFNKAFGDLKIKDREKQLAIAKVIPFAGTNTQLQEEAFDYEDSQMWKLLMGLRACGLKNDAMLDVFYDVVMENYRPGRPYAVLIYHGVYDIPRKGADHQSQWESEEVYEYILCAICPVDGDYECEKPEFGFLFPAYSDRSANLDCMDLYREQAGAGTLGSVEADLIEALLG